MKKFLAGALALLLILSFGACKKEEEQPPAENSSSQESQSSPEAEETYKSATKILLGETVTVNGEPAGETGAVQVGGEIVYYKNIDKYESGNLYGEGIGADKHTEAEAAGHILVTITKPGEYLISGEMKGQIAVDLGEEAENNPEARVILILNGADITCEIAPAVIFYNVYECSSADEPTETPNTATAGAVVIIADGSVNNINGSYVARIYKDNAEGKKLHKYDGAFYSKKSLNIEAGIKGTGVLNITAENEGLNSEMHLTVNGGNININAQNDGINTNEDGVSVTTVNGGTLNVKGGLGAEGDGIDSNGWLVINGGTVMAFGSGRTGDGGIDADMGILLNGGSVAAFGGRNDNVTPGENQTCVQFTFAAIRGTKSTVKFVDETGYGMIVQSDREFQSLVLAGENLEKNKEYKLYVNDIMQEYSGNASGGYAGPAQRPNEQGKPDMNNPFMLPEGFEEWLENDKDIPDNIRAWLENIEKTMGGFGNVNMPEKEQDKPQPEQGKEPENNGDFGFIGLAPAIEDPTAFVITDEIYSFSGVCDSEAATGKIRAEFTVNQSNRMEDLYIGDLPGITSVECSQEVPKYAIQLTLEYIGGEKDISISRICLLSEGYKAVNKLFEEIPVGEYRLTVAVVSENKEFTGSNYFVFSVVE